MILRRYKGRFGMIYAVNECAGGWAATVETKRSRGVRPLHGLPVREHVPEAQRDLDVYARGAGLKEIKEEA